MKRLPRTMIAIVLGAALATSQGCQTEARSDGQSSEPAEAGKDTTGAGKLQLRSISPDGIVQELYRYEFGPAGGLIVRRSVTDASAPADPCPCCPDWIALSRVGTEADTIPGCCKPCYNFDRTTYRNQSLPERIDTLFRDLLSDSCSFERPGTIIADITIEVSRSDAARDSADVAFRISVSGPPSESTPADRRERTWRIPGGEASYWIQFREEFRVGAAGVLISLDGKSRLTKGGDTVKARIMHLSYFPDLDAAAKPGPGPSDRAD